MAKSKDLEIIAEVGQAHEGNIEMAHSYIKSLAETGVDTVKFQVHIAEAESSIHEPFRVKMNSFDKTRFDYWKRMEFSIQEWRELKKNCEASGMEFLASPFSNAAVDLLEELGVKRYKIGSGEVNNFLLLEKIARTRKPIILSSGMSSFSEIDQAVNFLKNHEIAYSILQCTTAYPTSPENYGLNIIEELKERYEVPIGYSDHSGSIATSIAAVSLGAVAIEFHAVFDRNSPGPDATSSLEMAEIKELVPYLRNIRRSLNFPIDKENNEGFTQLKNIFEKSLAINRALPKGCIIQFEDLEAKKPKGFGIEASEFQKVVGKKLNRSMEQWEFLNYKDFN